MTPTAFLANVINPGLVMMDALITDRPVSFASPQVKVMLLTIALQESNCAFRRQVGGPARSYWQFERGGGVAGVINHPVVGPWLKTFCGQLDIPFTAPVIYEAMAWCDPLAVTMARLLLWTDRSSIPPVGSVDDAWIYYLRNWRPGKPGPARWPALYKVAASAVALLSP